MAKYLLRLEARKLRSEGKSIGSISQKLMVSKGSVSWWVRDLSLTTKQIQMLDASEQKGKSIGRLKTIQVKEKKRLDRIKESALRGMAYIPNLNKQQLLIAGVALYWAEGGKSSRNKRVEFCNSDPKMIEFILQWFVKCLDIKLEEFRLIVGINQIHKNRDYKVKKYWSNITGIPLKRFRKTSFKKVNNSKVYDNFEDHYGTLTIVVARSTELYYKIMGLIEGLIETKYMAA